MIREWHCIQLYKCHSLGYASGGVDFTKAGDLAVKCPACPYPHINLPPGWQATSAKLSAGYRWIYKLFTAMDGNMKAVQLNASSEARDPGLTVGCTYFQNPVMHHQHIEMFNKQFPILHSMCNNHKVISSSVGVTGVFSIFCMHHKTFCPDRNTDLWVGERQVDIDFAYIGSLQLDSPDNVASGYNVNFQYSIHLLEHGALYPPELQLPMSANHIQFFVPKFHLNAHQESCHIAFSYNWTPKVARTDGEGPECSWHVLNPLASSTK
ncbi:hypothetical protein GYMLUDRAFT_161123 [Collybiopsis luxurians FD-317 M1]|nr:hypothetical protein GYMLUDRAFT_161123 [Collybiopsis luxurians FD-317 M1]